MEQAVNQFNKGLQKDTNPMVQSNDTLTDALNATFITMNGNEVILQNDMGNRRVDNAYLPPGYTPVGMKEYGGIIYVAAYNPITNRSQIGSFPSPERKISSNDSDIGGTLDLSKLTEGQAVASLCGLKCITQDTILIPLTKDTSLHAGDKFVVSSKDLRGISSQITNYNNTTESQIVNYNSSKVGKKIYTPKNKKYTLALGILNSQNEFVDITKSLVRWDKQSIKKNFLLGIIDTSYKNTTSPISYVEDLSDSYKFNDGYFIPNIYNYSSEESNTKSDSELIQERLTNPANTYAYKLVGPLYLQAKLNHIQEFSYNIYGIYDSTNIVLTLYIESYITYNCPDGITKKDPVDDPDYYTYEEGQICPAIENYKSSLSINNKFITSSTNLKTFQNAIKEHSQNFYVGKTGLIDGSTSGKIDSGTIKIVNDNNIWKLNGIVASYNSSNLLSTSDSEISLASNDSSSKYIVSPVFDLYQIKTNNTEETLTLRKENTDFTSGNTKYDPSTNLYKCKIVKKYVIKEENIPEDKIFNYVLGVRSSIMDGPTDKSSTDVSYLSGLSTKGNIDISLLGSGKVVLKGWRFYNYYDEEKTVLTYNFDAYPEYGHQFDNLTFIFYNSKDPTDITTITGTIYNGRNTITFNWNTFKKNVLYKVQWTYQSTDVNSGESTLNKSWESTDETQKDRWFLTTELFNECYNQNTDKFIEDYGNPKDGSTDKEKMYELFDEVMNQYYILDNQGKALIVNPNVQDAKYRIPSNKITEIHTKVGEEAKNKSEFNYKNAYLNKIYNYYDYTTDVNSKEEISTWTESDINSICNNYEEDKESNYFTQDAFKNLIENCTSDNTSIYLKYNDNIKKYYDEIEKTIILGNAVEQFNDSNKDVEYKVYIPEKVWGNKNIQDDLIATTGIKLTLKLTASKYLNETGLSKDVIKGKEFKLLKETGNPYIKVYWSPLTDKSVDYQLFVITRNGEPIQMGDTIILDDTRTTVLGSRGFQKRTELILDDTRDYCILVIKDEEGISNVTVKLTQSLRTVKCVQDIPKSLIYQSTEKLQYLEYYENGNDKILNNSKSSEIEVRVVEQNSTLVGYKVSRKNNEPLEKNDIIIHTDSSNNKYYTVITNSEPNNYTYISTATNIKFDGKLQITDKSITQIILYRFCKENEIVQDEFWRDSLVILDTTLKDASNNFNGLDVTNIEYYNWYSNILPYHTALKAINNHKCILYNIFRNTKFEFLSKISAKLEEYSEPWKVKFFNTISETDSSYPNKNIYFYTFSNKLGNIIMLRDYYGETSVSSSGEITCGPITNEDYKDHAIRIYNVLDHPTSQYISGKELIYDIFYGQYTNWWNIGDKITIEYTYSGGADGIVFRLYPYQSIPYYVELKVGNYTINTENTTYKFEYTFTSKVESLGIYHTNGEVTIKNITVQYADVVPKFRLAISDVVDEYIKDTIGKFITDVQTVWDKDEYKPFLGSTKALQETFKAFIINTGDDGFNHYFTNDVEEIKKMADEWYSRVNQYSFNGVRGIYDTSTGKWNESLQEVENSITDSSFLTLDQFNEKLLNSGNIFKSSSRQGDWIRAIYAFCQEKNYPTNNEQVSDAYNLLQYWLTKQFEQDWGYISYEAECVRKPSSYTIGNGIEISIKDDDENYSLSQDYELSLYNIYTIEKEEALGQKYIQDKYISMSSIILEEQEKIKTRDNNKSKVLETLETLWYNKSYYINDAIDALTTGEIITFKSLGEFEYTINFGDSVGENIENISTNDNSLYSGKAERDTYITSDIYYKWKWTKTHTINITFSPTIDFNSKLYPSFIEFPQNYTILQENPTSYLTDTPKNIEQNSLIGNRITNYITDTVENSIKKRMIKNGTLNQTITVTTIDYYWDTTMNPTDKKVKYFVNAYDYLKSVLSSQTAAMDVGHRLRGGHTDDHYIYICTDQRIELCNDRHEGSMYWNYSTYRIYTMISNAIIDYIRPGDGKELMLARSNSQWYSKPFFLNSNDHWVIFNQKCTTLDSLYYTYFFNLYFARYLDITLKEATQNEGITSPLYPTKEAYIKTGKYAIDLIFDTKLYLKEDTMIIDGPNESYFNCTYPTFKCKYNRIPYSKSFKISNSQRYIDEVLNYDPENTSSIYSRFGDKDYKGDYLNSNLIYRLEYDGKLHKVDVPYMIIQNNEGTIQGLRYKGGKISKYSRSTSILKVEKDKTTQLLVDPCDDNINVIYPYTYYDNYKVE